MAKLTIHVQPFTLNIKSTCMQPSIYRRTQSHAGLALPDYSRYFHVVRIVSMSSSRYKQRWRITLRDTRHPIMLRQSLVFRTSFELRHSFVLRRFLFSLHWSLLVLRQVLASASMVLARALTVLARASTVLAHNLKCLACDSMGLTRDSTGLACASTVLTQRFISLVTRDKVWSIRCCGCVYLVLVQKHRLIIPTQSATTV